MTRFADYVCDCSIGPKGAQFAEQQKKKQILCLLATTTGARRLLGYEKM